MAERTEPKKTTHGELLRMTTDVVTAYLAKNRLGAVDVSKVIGVVFSSLAALEGQVLPAAGEAQRPAVPVKRSVMPEHIVCLEDGKKLKMLKRHLMTRYGMTPDDYRIKWGLPGDYPMVAPNYAEQRRTLAKSIGLGTKRTSKPRGRPRKNPA